MAKFISHGPYCGSYFVFLNYDIENRPLEVINKYKIRNNKYNFNSYQGINNVKSKDVK